jgi:8-oxo-dGTP diphosphatase
MTDPTSEPRPQRASNPHDHDHRKTGEGAFCPYCATRLEEGLGPGGLAECPACFFVRFRNPKVAAGVVAERDGKILLIRRNHEPALGKWSFPSGFVDAGEVVAEAAAREAEEEAHVTVRIDRLLGVFSSPGDPVIFVAYGATVVSGDPSPGDEAFEVGLFAPDALPELAFDHDGEIVAAWGAFSSTAGSPENS